MDGWMGRRDWSGWLIVNSLSLSVSHRLSTANDTPVHIQIIIRVRAIWERTAGSVGCGEWWQSGSRRVCRLFLLGTYLALVDFDKHLSQR